MTPAALETEAAMTAQEVAELVHVHVNTVKREFARGALPGFRIGRRGDLRFWPADVAAYLRRPGS